MSRQALSLRPYDERKGETRGSSSVGLAKHQVQGFLQFPWSYSLMRQLFTVIVYQSNQKTNCTFVSTIQFHTVGSTLNTILTTKHLASRFFRVFCVFPFLRQPNENILIYGWSGFKST